jgi:hypothetical protein
MYQLKSATDSVGTPQYIIDSLKSEFGEMYDPCPLNPKFDAKIHKDGLTTEWGDVSYCNPPFSKSRGFVKKAYTEWKKGKTCVVLVKNTITNSNYFRDFVAGNAEIRFIHGTVKFNGYERGAWFPLLLLVFWKNKRSNNYKCVTYDASK